MSSPRGEAFLSRLGDDKHPRMAQYGGLSMARKRGVSGSALKPGVLRARYGLGYVRGRGSARTPEASRDGTPVLLLLQSSPKRQLVGNPTLLFLL